MKEKDQEETLTGEKEETLVQEKCTRQFALSVGKNVKFHSNQQKGNPFTAKNALEKKEGINFLSALTIYILFLIYFFIYLFYYNNFYKCFFSLILVSEKLSNREGEFLEDLIFYREECKNNLSTPNNIRYYFAAQRFYRLMFEKTNSKVYRELFDLNYSIYNKLVPIQEGFEMYHKA